MLRGLHFQKEDAAQAKLIGISKGIALDVIVDIRPESLTYGKYVKIELSSKNNKRIFIPKGMAHGFLALSEEVIFDYKCDNYYSPEAEGGIIYNDSTLDIDWKLSNEELKVSEKDLVLPTLDKVRL